MNFAALFLMIFLPAAAVAADFAPQAMPDKALVYLYRMDTWPVARMDALFSVSGTRVAALRANSHTWIYLPKGGYRLEQVWDSRSTGEPMARDFSVTGGRTYYFRLNVEGEIRQMRWGISEIAAAPGAQEVAKLDFLQPDVAEPMACAMAYAAKNWPAALAACTPLVEKSDPAAQVRLGMMHANGLGLPQDDAAAVRFFRLAAERGYPLGELMLGSMHAAGEGGLQRDPAEAARWFARAAEKGLAQAQYRLAIAYRDGSGVAQDSAGAYFWLTLALERLTGAQRTRTEEAREKLRPRITQEQQDAAARSARDWKPKQESGAVSAPKP